MNIQDIRDSMARHICPGNTISSEKICQWVNQINAFLNENQKSAPNFDKWFAELMRNPAAIAYNNPLSIPVEGDTESSMRYGWNAAISIAERQAAKAGVVTGPQISDVVSAMRIYDGSVPDDGIDYKMRLQRMRAALASVWPTAGGDGLTQAELEDSIKAIESSMSLAGKLFLPRGWDVLLEKLRTMLKATIAAAEGEKK